VLAGTTLGDRLIRFQQANSHEAATLIASHRSLQRRLLKLLEVGSPLVRSLVMGDGAAILDRAMIGRLKSYVRAIARRGSPPMRKELLLLWDELNLRAYAGRPVGSIWQEQHAGVRPSRRSGRFSASYEAMSFEERATLADTIIAGWVTEVSDTRWNQDSGECWRESEVTDNGRKEVISAAFPIYTATVAVTDAIVPEKDVAETVTLTVIGVSPNEYSSEEGSLRVGENVLVLARQLELGWREGIRPVLGLMGDPRESFFQETGEGLYQARGAAGRTLNDLINQIRHIRSRP
jgi:hypothetical protein